MTRTSAQPASALRRLGKPSWMVVYNGEDHNLVERKNRKDWSIRMQQFFDHYLKDAPAPRWMTESVQRLEFRRGEPGGSPTCILRYANWSAALFRHNTHDPRDA